MRHFGAGSMVQETGPPIARSLALALTTQPVDGGSKSLTSAPVAADAIYKHFLVEATSEAAWEFPDVPLSSSICPPQHNCCVATCTTRIDKRGLSALVGNV
eukprot:CAMPEP_0181172464 /NCGR_PEP_ID=MMETSP1096-20121128/2462_1 /TAXON_ID=156174 ORGANISM="Chrysochromulina ericina, Strain CCMP281" /NCGR_SAMPLE_ID=MMETSP1096 /ASSEMBLY_ACC=CAM_ASM_000453 /LENGTH=100 /DNA_ID=CAMNT_0023260191 /DNA_START=165 /DNA_END=463 /DNA_ORIENTATION=+